MKLSLQTQLLPTQEQAASLETTMRAFNAAADWLAGEAFARRTENKIALQKLFYQTLRKRFGLSAQMAVRCIAQACEAYKRDKTKRPHFRPFAAIPHDQRLMSFKGVDRVSLLTLSGPYPGAVHHGSLSGRAIHRRQRAVRSRAAQGQQMVSACDC
jgi:predicted transposase